MPAPPYVVAVRTLCEFAAKRGDLDLRFTPSATALEGQAGHTAVVARRGAAYQAELSLSGEFENLRVRGRADGYDAARQQLEEIKTYRGDLSAMPPNRRQLHWAQLKVYGALLCRQLGLDQVHLALVYFDVGSQTETVLRETHTAQALQQVFEAQCRQFLGWAEQEGAHRLRRDEALTALAFAHAEFRPGQRQLSEAVYKAASAGRCVMVQAPTGIGKTVGTLFAQLKACPSQAIDKLFFLAAKTPGRALALDALAALGAGAGAANTRLPLRVLELVARDKACEHPDKACHGESCPLARGFYDRLAGARAGAVAQGWQDQASLRRVALAHQVCPYYLGQELVRWSDVVVGDYNYHFDVSAMLHGLTRVNEWRVGLLVDEAHNLVSRARSMYSAVMARSQVAAVRRGAPALIKNRLSRLARCWSDLVAAQGTPYTVLAAVPVAWLTALQQCITAIGEHLEDHPVIEPALLRFYFDALHFSRLHESFGEHSICDLSEVMQELAGPRTAAAAAATAEAQAGADVQLCLRNVVPAPFLKPRFAACHTVALFSATLSPPSFYADLLGLPENTAQVDVVSPFDACQLNVRIARHISTRYVDRPRSLQPIAALMAAQFQQLPGNYLAFFSSFDYLQQAADTLAACHPDIPLWLQARQMDEAQRAAFLARFSADGRGIGFAVLGGAFAEAIDLPGRRLIGAFVATLGLPQLNPVNEQMKAHMTTLFGAAGHDYTYLYPGLQKVVQAAGRVIRSPSDTGTLHLIDDRFARPEVRRLLPAWWRVERPERLPARGPASARQGQRLGLDALDLEPL